MILNPFSLLNQYLTVRRSLPLWPTSMQDLDTPLAEAEADFEVAEPCDCGTCQAIAIDRSSAATPPAQRISPTPATPPAGVGHPASVGGGKSTTTSGDTADRTFSDELIEILQLATEYANCVAGSHILRGSFVLADRVADDADRFDAAIEKLRKK